MKILARGKKIRTEELKQKLSSFSCELTIIDDTNSIPANVELFDVIFDLNFDDYTSQLHDFAALANKLIFVSAAKTQLAKAVSEIRNKPACRLFGINAIPGFLNKDVVELSLYSEEDKTGLDKLMALFGWKYKQVEDRVGMVTPRIIFMIMNEACYTVQEGTATMQDIDTSMKLGTNYPFGPFEWADKIGIKDVYETLAALYNDTKEERYKIAPLLKTKYLRSETFYQ